MCFFSLICWLPVLIHRICFRPVDPDPDILTEPDGILTTGNLSGLIKWTSFNLMLVFLVFSIFLFWSLQGAWYINTNIDIFNQGNILHRWCYNLHWRWLTQDWNKLHTLVKNTIIVFGIMSWLMRKYYSVCGQCPGSYLAVETHLAWWRHFSCVQIISSS